MIEIIKSGKMFLLIADIDDLHDIKEIKEALSVPYARSALKETAHMKFTAEQKNDILSMLAEGFHTAFRKGCSAPEATEIHNMIGKMDNKEWSNVIDFVGGPLIEMLEDAEWLAPAEKKQKQTR